MASRHRIQTFVALGNIIRTGGIDFFEYMQAQLWTPQVWSGLALFIALLGGLMMGAITDSLIDWLAGLRRRTPQDPVVGVYLVGVALFAVSAGFARYILTDTR